jgi:hypothetical protein
MLTNPTEFANGFPLEAHVKPSEAGAENMETQLWFSVYGFSTAIVSQIEPRWSAELTRILA